MTKLEKPPEIGAEQWEGGGESAGGPYPRAQRKRDGSPGHGGQSEIAYHGSGQLGDQATGPENPNAPAKGG